MSWKEANTPRLPDKAVATLAAVTTAAALTGGSAEVPAGAAMIWAGDAELAVRAGRWVSSAAFFRSSSAAIVDMRVLYAAASVGSLSLPPPDDVLPLEADDVLPEPAEGVGFALAVSPPPQAVNARTARLQIVNRQFMSVTFPGLMTK